MWYRFFRPSFKIFLHVKYDIEVKGKKNIPKRGRVILAANHQRVDDSLLIAAFATKRLVRFAAKSQYFDGKSKPFGKIIRWFFVTLGMIRIDRNTTASMFQLFKGAVSILEADNVVAIFPGGTRVKAGNTEKLMVGIVVVARKTKSPIVPIGMSYQKSRKYRRQKAVENIGAPVPWSHYDGMSDSEVLDDLQLRIHSLKTPA